MPRLLARVLTLPTGLARLVDEAARGGWPESERARFVRETCEHRPRDCLAVLAEWVHEVPRSGVRRRLREALTRPGAPRHGLDPSRVEPLSRLFEEHAMLPAGEEGVTEAILATRRLGVFFHFAAPIPRAAVRARRHACESEPARRDRCIAAREGFERVLGRLGAP